MSDTLNHAVTRDSALEAIAHLDRSNSPGRRREAVEMLCPAAPASAQPAPQPAARAAVPDGLPVVLNEFKHNDVTKTYYAPDYSGSAALIAQGYKPEPLVYLRDVRAMLAASPATVTAPAAPATKGTAGQDQRALELAHGALIAAQPRDAQPAGWERHEKAINAVAAALHKPSAAGMVGQDAKDAAEMLDLLKDAARAWNNESDSELDATMERVECFLLDHRATLAAQQAQASAKDRYLEASADLDAATDNFYGRVSVKNEGGAQ